MVPQPLLANRVRRRRVPCGDARRAGGAVRVGGVAVGTHAAGPVARAARTDRRARSRELARARRAGRYREVRPRTIRAVHASVLRDDGRWPVDHEREQIVPGAADPYGEGTAAASATGRAPA